MTAPEMPWLPISPPFSITRISSARPAAFASCPSRIAPGETRRSGADEQDVDFELIAFRHDDTS